MHAATDRGAASKYSIYIYHYRRIPRLRPPFCMLGLGKSEEGAYTRDPYISVLSLAVWWAKLEKNNKVRQNVTHIASLLAVATVFIDLWTPFYSQGGGGLYVR